jgi:hypothetical protein
MLQMLCSAIFALTSCCCLAQEDNVVNFQKEHPQIEFISLEKFNTFTSEEIALLKGNFIVFSDELSAVHLPDLQTSSELKNINSNSSKNIEKSFSDLDQIKIWFVTHADVKIVKRSEFNNLSTEDQTLYMDNHYLILLGETLTLIDTQLYPY